MSDEGQMSTTCVPQENCANAASPLPFAQGLHAAMQEAMFRRTWNDFAFT
jgi:hypothetical protein